MTSLPAAPPKTKVSLNRRTGLLEVYDVQTGKLVAVQESRTAIAENSHKLVERLLPDGSRIMVEATIDPLKLMNFQFKEYSSYVVDLICEKIVEGNSLTKICETPGFPSYSELCRWKKTNPDIQKQIDEARRDRAEFMRDQLYDVMRDTDERNVDSSKAKIEALKYLAGTDDKHKYGNVKTGVEVAAPIQIVVNTGIVRAPQIKDVGETHGEGNA